MLIDTPDYIYINVVCLTYPISDICCHGIPVVCDLLMLLSRPNDHQCLGHQVALSNNPFTLQKGFEPVCLMRIN